MYKGKEIKKLSQHIQELPEQDTQCPHCRREIIRTWRYCPSCGKQVSDAIISKLSMTDAENASHLLKGLINYHERVMGFGTDGKEDRYLGALRYSLMLVESLFEQGRGDTV